MDGANVEMSEAVGKDNIFIFGMNAREVADVWANGYNSTDYYFKQPRLRAIVEDLNSGFGSKQFPTTCCVITRLPTRICVLPTLQAI